MAKRHIEPSNSELITKTPKTPEEWFTSNENPSITSRNLFKASDKLDSFNKYLTTISQEGQTWWTNSPQTIALIFFGYIEFAGYAPDELTTYYGYNDSAIVTIIIKKAQADITKEARIDLTNTDNKWKVVWTGDRIVALK